MNPQRIDRIARATAATLACATCSAAANAEHYGYYNGPTDFYVRVTWMPDFDQKRDVGPGILGLPQNSDGEGGGMYCVPTSAADLLGYIKTHGYDDPADAVTPPGSFAQWNDFTQSSVYNQVTTFIDDVGVTMGTDPDNGTSNFNFGTYNGLRDRLDDELFDVEYFAWTNQWAPTGTRLGEMMADGAIVMMCYGRYLTGGIGSNTLIARDGGHCVALTKVDRRPSVETDHYTLGYANPANSSNTITQADFRYAQRDSYNRNFVVEEWADGGGLNIATQLDFGSITLTVVVDSCIAVFPKKAMTMSPDGGITVFSGSLEQAAVGTFETKTHSPPVGATITDAKASPDRTLITYLAAPPGGTPTFYRLNAASGQTEPIAQLPGARAHCFSRDGTAYVLTGAEVIRYDTRPPSTPGATSEIQRAAVGGAAAPDDIAYDDDTDRVLVLSAATGQVIAMPPDLTSQTLHTLPGWSPGAATGSIDSADGVTVCATAADVRTYTSDPASGQFVQSAVFLPPPPMAIGGVSAGADGSVYSWYVGENTVFRLEPDSAGGFSRETTGRPGEVVGLPASGFLYTSRDRTNYIPALHSGPGWRNLDPDELPDESQLEIADCRADQTRPFELLDFLDAGVFLDRLASNDPEVDLDADGTLDGSDVSAFLSDLSAGCE